MNNTNPTLYNVLCWGMLDYIGNTVLQPEFSKKLDLLSVCTIQMMSSGIARPYFQKIKTPVFIGRVVLNALQFHNEYSYLLDIAHLFELIICFVLHWWYYNKWE